MKSLSHRVALALGLLTLAAGLPLATLAESAESPRLPDPGAALALLESMERRVLAVRDYTCTLVTRERYGDEFDDPQRMLVKWARPSRFYMKILDGNRVGQEVLWVKGANRDRLRVSRGSFPDITLNLDPRGGLAMSRTHHPASEASLGRLVGLVMGDVRKAGERGEGRLWVAGAESFLDRSTWRIEARCPSSTYQEVLGSAENIWGFAERNASQAYVLVHANRSLGIRRLSDFRPEQRVTIPRYYAGRMTLWVDRETSLPLGAEIFDHEGLPYERYEHHGLAVDVGLTDRDFDPENPAYDF